uniref:EB1 C-terminal domain-containing protein n=1 Tax=Strongyloides papillosus TaxID=174720 RepID=A0A0N5BHU4_STREA
MARTINRIFKSGSSGYVHNARENVNNVTKKTVPYHDDTINDTTVISDISSIRLDDSDCLGGESENAVDTLLDCTPSSFYTSTNITSLERTVVSRGRQCSCNTKTNYSDYPLSLTQTLIEDGGETGERDVTVDVCNNTSFFKVEDFRGEATLPMPIAESTRIDSKVQVEDIYSKSMISKDVVLYRSLYTIEEVTEGIVTSDGSGTKRPAGSRRLARGLSKSITLNDTRDIDTTIFAKENSSKQRDSQKEDSDVFSEDMDAAKQVLFERIKEVYVATKMEEKEKGRPLTELEMEEFQLKIKRVAESYCVDYLKLKL